MTSTLQTNDHAQRARELAMTIREGLVHLTQRNSPAVRDLLPQALSAVEASVAGHDAVRAASAAMMQLLERCNGSLVDTQAAQATLARYDEAISLALQPVIPVKLVIWDLDETFWRGTLAEMDEVVIPPSHLSLIDSLTQRGIVNSICSKNDFSAAQAVLQDAGVWDRFVFPRIAFAAKGELIRDIIEQAQLRAPNVLFIDDNRMNLEEARHYNPGLQTLEASQIPQLLQLPALAGKPDGGQRLAQYKLLEQRARERTCASSNEEFLRQSDIRVSLCPTKVEDAERVHEMLVRTNQLNFTKQRLSVDDVRALILDPKRSTATVSVRDRFGDHGVVGWYCLHDATLEHYLFSCRIINLGIEQFVYQHLGRPQLHVVGETASSPFDAETALDYITLETGAPSEGLLDGPPLDHAKLRIFASGACDMYYLVGTLSNALTDVTFECNTFRGATRGVNVATEYLRSCFEMTESHKAFCQSHFHNYTGQAAFKTRLFDGTYDYAFFSFNDDAELFVYEHREQSQLRVVLSESANYSVTPVRPPGGQDPDRWLNEHFECRGLITPERFRENLLWIAERLPRQTRLLLMTLPEFDYFRDALPRFPQYRRQCIRLNHVIRQLCAADPRFCLVEMNDHVTSRSHFTDYVMHLRAEQGFQLACEALHRMAEMPVDTGLAAQLEAKGLPVALLGSGLEALPHLLALKAAGVAVDVCATEAGALPSACKGEVPCLTLQQFRKQAHRYFPIVTPQLAADPKAQRELGLENRERWILPKKTFNLDWKER